MITLTDNINIGDICTYSYDNHNKSLSIVEVVRHLSDEVAEVKFHQVMCDESGNGYFTYLCRTGYTMNVSKKYLHRIDIVHSQQKTIVQLQSDLRLKENDCNHLEGKYADAQAAVKRANERFVNKCKELQTAKAETVKIFAEKLKTAYDGFDEKHEVIVFDNLVCAIDAVTKEMEGDSDA